MKFKLYEQFNQEEELKKALELFGKKSLEDCKKYAHDIEAYVLGSSSCATNLKKDSILFLYLPNMKGIIMNPKQRVRFSYGSEKGIHTGELEYFKANFDKPLFMEVTSDSWKKCIETRSLDHVIFFSIAANPIYNHYKNSELETDMRDEPSSTAGSYLYANISLNIPWENIIMNGIAEDKFDENDLKYLDPDGTLRHRTRAKLTSKKFNL